MRRFLTFALSLLLCLTSAACGSLPEDSYYRQGIGTKLHWAGMAEATHLQDEYIDLICQQAGLATDGLGGADHCGTRYFTPRDWAVFVHAGMNDIDQRCDAYLAWLDDKKRSSAPILKQIADMSSTTSGIMRVAGSGADAITIVGAAFGIAADTFTNVNSRLLHEINHSTVQTVVFRRRNEYRMSIVGITIDNRPAAIHALRSYLSLCMPFTIETEINTTVTAFERGGPGALTAPPLITAATVGPIKAADPISKPSSTRKTASGAYKNILFGDPASYTDPAVKRALRAICVPAGELGSVTTKTGDLIHIFETKFHRIPTHPRIDGKLDNTEISHLNGYKPCTTSAFRNYYERTMGKKAIASLVGQLRETPHGVSLAADAELTAPSTRAAIKAVKAANGFPNELADLRDQVTPDFIDCLDNKECQK